MANKNCWYDVVFENVNKLLGMIKEGASFLSSCIFKTFFSMLHGLYKSFSIILIAMMSSGLSSIVL